MTNQVVVIVGAARSGTNMLRDVLTQIPRIATWPCDEINYIWRHGNVTYPSDEIPLTLASPTVIGFVRREFRKMSRRRKCNVIVEKTCANSLRIPFVDKILPDVKYIFIVRDGVDVVASAMMRWTAKLDIPYLYRKARFIPFADVPYYASRYLFSRMHRLFSREKRVATWGPCLENMEKLQKRYSLPQICALQWRACVELAARDLRSVAPGRFYNLRYEKFVKHPSRELRSILNFIGWPVSDEIVASVTNAVNSASVGRGWSQLDEKQLEEIMPLINRLMEEYGYRT